MYPRSGKQHQRRKSSVHQKSGNDSPIRVLKEFKTLEKIPHGNNAKGDNKNTVGLTHL